MRCTVLTVAICLIAVGCTPAPSTAPPSQGKQQINAAPAPQVKPVSAPSTIPAPTPPNQTPPPPVPPTKPATPESVIVVDAGKWTEVLDDYQNPIKADAKYLGKLVSMTISNPDKVWKEGGKYYVGTRWQLVGQLGEPLSQDADCLSYVWELSPEGAKQFAAIPAKARLTITGRCKGTRPARGIGRMTYQVFFTDCTVRAAVE